MSLQSRVFHLKQSFGNVQETASGKKTPLAVTIQEVAEQLQKIHVKWKSVEIFMKGQRRKQEIKTLIAAFTLKF